MKFEKFFKSVGTHGIIVKKSDTESWLLGGGVGMRIPEGVNNLGVSVSPDDLFTQVMEFEPSVTDVLELAEAYLPKDGKANDIVRIFETDFGDRINIHNKHYGLLEKSDSLYLLSVPCTVEDGQEGTLRVMVVHDTYGEPVGFILE